MIGTQLLTTLIIIPFLGYLGLSPGKRNWHAMFHTAPYTIESPGYLKVAGESLPRRHPRAKHGLLQYPTEGVLTVFDIVRNSAKLYPYHKTVGTRRLIKMHREFKIIEDKKKEWIYYELGPYNYLNYSQYEQLTIQIGSGLRKLGLCSSSKIYLFGTTRYAFPSKVAP